MKRKKMYILTLAALSCALILSLGTFITSFAKENSTKEQVTTMATTANLNLRADAGLHGKVITVMPKGTSVEVFSMTSAGWYKVKYKDQTGYAYYVYLNFEGTDKGTVNDGKITHMYATAPLNVRSNPNTGSAILGSFKKGDAVQVISKHDGWFKVDFNGKHGYCHGGYLDFGKGEASVTVDESTMNDMVTTAPLNVRDRPGMKGKIIGSFKKGETVKVIGQEGDWLKVKYKSTTGYSHVDYLN